MRGMLSGFATAFTPIVSRMARTQETGHIVQYRTVHVGFGGRGTSGMLPNYSSMHAERNLVSYVRKQYLFNLNLTAEDHDWSLTVAGKPVAPRSIVVGIVQKKDKRRIINLEPLIQQLSDAFPEATFKTISWESIRGGATAEARELLNMHICVSSDGTGANQLFMLPPGSGEFDSFVLNILCKASLAVFVIEWCHVNPVCTRMPLTSQFTSLPVSFVLGAQDI